MEKLIAKLNAAPIALVIETVKGLNETFVEGSDIALDAALNNLEKRMPAVEFIALCDSL